MLLRKRQPGPPLAMHVDYLWHLSDAPGHSTERVLPTGTLELVINLSRDAFHVRTHAGSQHLSGAMVSGAYTRYFSIDTRDHADLLGVHFKPGGAWPILGVAPGDLEDQHCDLENLWGRSDALRLREQLLAAPSARRLGVLEDALSGLCHRGSRWAWTLHPACGYALEALSRGERVVEVASAVGLSSRWLQRVFREQIGATPKVYARIGRFQRVLDSLQADAALDWSSLALSAGYCDQSHLIREFHAIAGCAPERLVRAQDVPVKEHHLAVPGGSDLSNTRQARGTT